LQRGSQGPGARAENPPCTCTEIVGRMRGPRRAGAEPGWVLWVPHPRAGGGDPVSEWGVLRCAGTRWAAGDVGIRPLSDRVPAPAARAPARGSRGAPPQDPGQAPRSDKGAGDGDGDASVTAPGGRGGGGGGRGLRAPVARPQTKIVAAEDHEALPGAKKDALLAAAGAMWPPLPAAPGPAAAPAAPPPAPGPQPLGGAGGAEPPEGRGVYIREIRAAEQEAARRIFYDGIMERIPNTAFRGLRHHPRTQLLYALLAAGRGDGQGPPLSSPVLGCARQLLRAACPEATAVLSVLRNPMMSGYKGAGGPGSVSPVLVCGAVPTGSAPPTTHRAPPLPAALCFALTRSLLLTCLVPAGLLGLRYYYSRKVVLAYLDCALHTDMADIEQYYMKPPGSCFWVAVLDGNVVGIVAARAHTADNTVELLRMSVDSRFRGKGIAKALGRKVLEFALVHDYSAVVLGTTAVKVAAHKLYESLGFRHMGSSDRYVMPGMTLSLAERLFFQVRYHRYRLQLREE
ncbi:hypothetical protein EI555_012625, partial [Monodon monoceros]